MTDSNIPIAVGQPTNLDSDIIKVKKVKVFKVNDLISRNFHRTGSYQNTDFYSNFFCIILDKKTFN